MSWISVNEFKNITGIKIDDDTVQIALDVSVAEIVKKLFLSQRYEYGTSTTKHELYYPIADSNADGVISTSDVDV